MQKKIGEDRRSDEVENKAKMKKEIYLA